MRTTLFGSAKGASVVAIIASVFACAMLGCSTSHTIETNPHITVAADASRIVRASREWLVTRGHQVVSSSEYRVKRKKEIADVLTLATHGGTVTHFIELIPYPHGDSTEIDLFSYIVTSDQIPPKQPVIENDEDLLEEYQRGLDSLAMLLSR